MSTDRLTVSESIQLMKQEGSRLAKPVPVEGMPPMSFFCSFAADGAEPEEIALLPSACPSELSEFWTIARTAKLFEDREYGQWGLEILDPKRSVEITVLCEARRRRDFIEGDLVIGKFLGDSDLLVIRCDPIAKDFGCVIVALPLDVRRDWYTVSHSFAAFLGEYAKTGGEKFWSR
jgi:hypothetical protein